MKARVEKACNTCGYRCFANCKTLVCPGAPHAPNCEGTLCHVITPLPGKRVSGVLCRDKIAGHNSQIEILFLPGASLSDITLYSGIWRVSGEDARRTWTVKRWKEQYSTLPRKGSKQMVIIELTSNGK
ncbi:hypothetical protein KAR91_12705 [Candidatus Pacearchaeota archaeon]|nr:hypothetical protein [Candidatus Pacearchaeota archaeon]